MPSNTLLGLWGAFEIQQTTVRHLLTVVSCTFVHGSIDHLLGNMVFLFLIGGMVESVYGSVVFYILYFTPNIVMAFIYMVARGSTVEGFCGSSGGVLAIYGVASIDLISRRLRFKRRLSKTNTYSLLFIMALLGLSGVLFSLGSLFSTDLRRGFPNEPAIVSIHIVGFSVGLMYGYAHYRWGIEDQGGRTKGDVDYKSNSM